MRLTTKPPETAAIASAEEAAEEEAHLARDRATLAALEAEFAAVGEELGRVLDATSRGDRDARPEAGKLSMKRSGLAADADTLRLTMAPRAARLADWRAGERDRDRAYWTAEARRHSEAGARLEAVVAEQRVALQESIDALAAERRGCQDAKGEAGRCGATYDELRAIDDELRAIPTPRDPAYLWAKAATWRDAASARARVAQWFGRLIPLPPTGRQQAYDAFLADNAALMPAGPRGRPTIVDGSPGRTVG